MAKMSRETNIYVPRENAHEMIGVLGHDSALQGYTGPETTANEMNFVTNYALGTFYY